MNRKTIAALIFSVLVAAAAAALRPQGAVHGAAGLAPLAGLQDPLPTGCFHINIPIVMREFAGVPVAGVSPAKYSRPMADYNADGCADLAIGIPGKEVDGEDFAGSVMIVYGSLASWTAGPYTQVLAPPDPIAQDQFGYTLAHGDFNADGFSDLAVGAVGRTVLGASGAGQVRVFYGSISGLDGAQYTTFDQVNLIDFPEANDQFSRGLAAGDFNGDGYDDLAAGAPGEDYQAVGNSGVLHIIFGSGDGLTTTGDIRYAQNDLNTGDLDIDSYFGASLAAGDFDRDGYDDIAVGVWGESILAITGAGAVDILFGSPAGPTTANLFIDQSLMPNSSVAEDDHFGSDVAIADFNGDSYADLAIGSYGEWVSGLENAGAAFVMYGTNTGLSFAGIQKWSQANLEGVEEAFDQFGFDLGTGDFNGDGYDELTIGVPGENAVNLPGEDNAGAVNVVYGTAGGLTAAGNQIWHQDSPGIVGASAAHDGFGTAFTSGDFNRDGYTDIAIGVHGDNFVPGVVDNSGEVNILYGTAAGLSSAGNLRLYQALAIIPGESEDNDWFGFALP